MKILRCFFCSGFFTLSSSELYKHIQTCHKCKNKCTVFYHSSTAQCNVAANRTFTCTVCRQVFSSCKQLMQHVESKTCAQHQGQQQAQSNENAGK